MKRFTIFCILLVLIISAWTWGPITREARALTVVSLKSPPDSTKVPTGTPTFQWDSFPPARETIKKFHIKLSSNPNFSSVIWEDTTIEAGLRSMVYDGPPLTLWQAYYWTMRVKVDSLTMGDTVITYWQEDFARTFTFFYTDATLIQIYKDPNITHLPNIQTAIIWAAPGDTVWVDTGTYQENLRFYKKKLLVTSNYIFDQDTATVNRTIIDGRKLTRGEDNGSVVYFSSAVDSSSKLMGFTIRGGTGSKVGTGTDATINGGGILCDVGSTPTIAYNVITENRAEHNGGGIYVNSAAPNILHNIITRNSALKGSGGGIECRFSIEVAASPAGIPGDGGGTTNESASESQSETSQEEIENALNPRDATEVASAGKPGALLKPAQNTVPVAVMTWFARRDTVIERDKYLVDDTIFFDGTQSYDPDYPADSIRFFEWWRLRHYRCWQAPPTSPQRKSQEQTFVFPLTEAETGLLDVYLRVTDYNNGRGYSDTVTFNVQNPPHVDAGSDIATPPGDTVWLDGTESCDVNPDDILSYHWTQSDGPVSVTIGNANSALAFFVPEDTTYLGIYVFQLKVADGMEQDSATVQVTISRAPIPVCPDDPTYGDTLVGFFIKQPVPLDGCASYDPDPGDAVARYLWQSGVRIFFDQVGDTARLPFTPTTNPNQCLNSYTPQFGGLFKIYLKVEDSFGVQSQIKDSVLYSVQYPPIALAGNDTILRPGNRAYLKGSAKEINPDQRDRLTYFWEWMRQPGSVNIEPKKDTLAVNFGASLSGIYQLELRVYDGFEFSFRDSVYVVANELPRAIVQNVSHAFEGDTVLLDASASYDPDSATFQAQGSTNAGGLKFAWSVKPPVPPGAETPVLVDADRRVAKFVPYGTGLYKFQVLVNDTISKNQPPVEGVNIAVLQVNVDSTYAYPIIQGNLISRNFAGSKGGGIDCNQSSPDIFDNILYKNKSNSSGGGISVRNLSTPQIERNILFGNVSSDSTGGGIADLKAQLSPSATRGFRKLLGIETNCFWDNGGGAMYQATGNISGNIYSFPRLIDPEFGDFRMECSSPCYPDIGSLIYFQPCHQVEHLGMVELSLFQNPVATAAVHFVVNTDVPLKAPPVAYVKIGASAPSPVYFSPISSKAYRGSHAFTSSGTAEISVFASSLLERDTTTTETFGVQLIGADNGGTLTSVDRKTAVHFPAGSVKDDIYAICMALSDDSRYQFDSDLNLEAVGEAYQLGPAVAFKKDLTLTFPLSDVDLEGKDRSLFAVYRYDNGDWSRLESFLDGNSVCAKVKTLDIFRLIYDPTGKHIAGIPQSYKLFQNYPNPFNPQTQIKYDLPNSGHVKLDVYNVLGQKVRVLVDETQQAGHQTVIWDGKDEGGREVASGIYFYKIKTEGYQKTKKMVLLK